MYINHSYPQTLFFPYMLLNTNITFKTNLSTLSNAFTKFISPKCHASKTSATLVKIFTYKDLLELHSFQVFILAKKNYCGCLVPTSFSCLLLVQEFWVDKCTLVKGFVQQVVSIIDGSLMSKLFNPVWISFHVDRFSSYPVLIITTLTISATLSANTCTQPIIKTTIIHNTTTMII